MEEIMQSLSHVDDKTTLLTAEHKEITMDRFTCYETIFFLIDSVTLTPKTIGNCSFQSQFWETPKCIFSFNRAYTLKVFFLFVRVVFTQVPKALSGPNI